jgi:succinate dehydrogenase / fumarate reductase cytochrome b subunit
MEQQFSLGFKKYDCFSVVLAFWHFLRFWVPEMVYKYVDASPLNETRYFHELAEKFESPIRTGLYLSFLLLSLHLWHGFSSSFNPLGLIISIQDH